MIEQSDDFEQRADLVLEEHRELPHPRTVEFLRGLRERRFESHRLVS